MRYGKTLLLGSLLSSVFMANCADNPSEPDAKLRTGISDQQVATANCQLDDFTGTRLTKVESCSDEADSSTSQQHFLRQMQSAAYVGPPSH